MIAIPVTPRTGPLVITLPDPVDPPQFRIGSRVHKYHQPAVLTVDGISKPNGNRPRYHFAEVRGWYSETVLSGAEG